jgi:microcystin-dependent protein
MATPYIGEITMCGLNFAPRGWAFCDGSLLAISSNTALFSILGTTYGGNGRTSFGLPDLRGRVPIQQGNGPGLSSRRLGERGGAETHTLTAVDIPQHNHGALVSNGNGTSQLPTDSTISTFNNTSLDNSNLTTLNNVVSNTGSGQAHNNMQPSSTVSFIIALIGVFPSRR